MRRAMILAAGLGTRLRPLTSECPKPLVPVGDRPLLAHVAAGLLGPNVQELVVNTYHLHEEFPCIFGEIEAKVHVLREVELLGTAGGVAGARPWLGGGPAIVANGDILCRPPVEQLLASASEGMILVVQRRPPGTGTLGLDGEGAVVRLRGRRFGREEAGADYVGVAALGPRCLATLPSRGCLIGDWALPELERGGRIGTVDLAGEWLDVGSLDAYLRANLAWLEELSRPRRGWFDRSGLSGQRTAENCWLGPGVRIDPQVELERSVVGAGCVIEGAGALTRCVIWPGARVRAPLRDAVVTGGGEIVSCLAGALS